MAERALALTKESADFLANLRKFGDRDLLNRQLLGFFNKEGKIIAGRIVKDALSGGNGLRRRTGSLARSMDGRGEIVGGVPAIRVGSLRGPALKYVALQEYGTVGAGGELPTIVPKGLMVKNLAIPINQALTPSGVPRKPRPGDWGKLHFIPFRKRATQNAQGALYAPSEYAKIRRAIKAKTFNGLKGYKALYLLVRKVDVRPKSFLRDGFTRYLPELNARLNAFIKSLWFAFGARGGRVR